MLVFLTIVAAILVAQVVALVFGVWMLGSERVLKWYCKKVVKMNKVLEDMVDEEFQKKDEE